MSQFNLPELELEILKYWNEGNIFKLTLEESKNRPIFNFYDGPPFANGSPHYGHLLASTIKDTICRFQTINGHYVPRINGFDVHGLPVEQLGEKVLGIKKTEEISWRMYKEEPLLQAYSQQPKLVHKDMFYSLKLKTLPQIRKAQKERGAPVRQARWDKWWNSKPTEADL